MKVLSISLGAIFLISLASLGAILLFIDPFKASVFNLSLFSVLAFLLFFSVLSIAGLWLRRKFILLHNHSRILKIIFRQSTLLAILFLSCLWLAHFGLSKPWTILPILVLVFGAEYYFLTRSQQHQ